MILISIILSFISKLFFNSVIKYISKNDNEITVDKIETLVITSIYMFFIYMFLKLYGLSMLFIFKYIVLIYLVITAFIDFKTQYVYCFFNRFMGIISVAYTLYLMLHHNFLTENIWGIIVAVAIAIIFSMLKVWGSGDSEIFIVISPFIAVYGIEYVLINFVLAMTISAIFNLIALCAKKINIKEQLAFAPYIAVSSLLIIMI